jgi:hypothetical protein
MVHGIRFQIYGYRFFPGEFPGDAFQVRLGFNELEFAFHISPSFLVHGERHKCFMPD